MAATELDLKFDAVLAALTGPGGRIVLGRDEWDRPLAANMPQTLPEFFKAFCALNASIEAVVWGDERLTFAEVDAHSDRLARGLVARGIAKGDRIGIAMRNCSAWIVAYMAALKAGGVATLINGWWRPDELAHALTLTTPTLILADAERARRIKATDGNWSVETIDIDQPIDRAMVALLAGASDSAVLPAIAPEDNATILFTSGSTGEAKGALSTHRQVTAGTYTYVTSLMVLLGILESSGKPPAHPLRALVSVPLFHVTGEVPVMLCSFAIGRTLVLMSKWDAGDALRLIEKERITAFTGVPTMSLELLNHPDRDRYDLSTLADINSGGAPRPVAHVERQAKEIPTARPVQGYGLTETNAVGCAIFWGNYLAKPQSTGRPQMPFVEVSILGPDDSHLRVGERGEIGLRSAATIKGYWNNPDATAAAYTDDHFLKTGDIGYLDPENYLFIVDRKKEIIIRGGENIAAAEVEAAIYACEGIAEAVVFGIPDERLGEVPVAVLHCRDAGTIDEEELRGFLAMRLAAFKIPAQMHFSDEPLPRLGTGKIDRVELRQKFGH
ncbi:MAG: class I adenylate-forming enzyme family protein [Sphingomicrobium sp.]